MDTCVDLQFIGADSFILLYKKGVKACDHIRAMDLLCHDQRVTSFSSLSTGRELGIDNEGLDFQQLEEYITNDTNL